MSTRTRIFSSISYILFTGVSIIILPMRAAAVQGVRLIMTKNLSLLSRGALSIAVEKVYAQKNVRAARTQLVLASTFAQRMIPIRELIYTAFLRER